MNAEIITVNAVNSSSQFLTHELASYGINVSHLTKSGDDCAHLREALRYALSQNDLVVIAGGLYTGECSSRDAVADVLGTPLELHEDSLERIREYYRNTGREMPDDSQGQAMLPRGCTVFPNDHGSAPGCAVTRYGQQVVLMPGTPSELLPMFSDYVAPYLSNLTDGTIVSRTVGVFGLSEAVLTERLADLMSEANPGVALYSKDGEAILRVTARAADRRAALALCDPVVEEIRQRLGVNVYGNDVGSLQKAVVALLLDKNMKIATAESCTAGLLSSRLTEVTGVSAVFECGIAAYSPEIKHTVLGVPIDLIDRFGTVSPEVAGAMATGARRVGNSSLGVGITGVAGPDTSEGKPVGTVYIAVADEKRVWVKKISIDVLDGDIDRESIRMLATSHALDLVRRYLEAMPTVMAGGEIINPEKPVVPTIPESGTVVKKRSFISRFLPCKGESKAEKVRKTALLIAILILLSILLSFVYMRVLRPFENQSLFRNLAELYDSSNPAVPTNADIEFPEGMQAQFYALYAKNTDVRGWVKIDDTNINYPVMQDNNGSYYSNHNFRKQMSFYGVPFFNDNAALVSPESVNRSLLIYDNNTNDGQMFSNLTLYYKNLDYFKKHPVIEMNTIFKNSKWKIFSVMVLTEPDSHNKAFDYTKSVFTDEDDFMNFAGELRIRSLYTMSQGQADVQEGDSLLLLSTDFENTAKYKGARLVIAARLVRSGESETVDLSGTSYNKSAVMPPEWPFNSSTSRSTSPVRTTSTLTQKTETAATSISDSDSGSQLTSASSTSKSRTSTSTHTTHQTQTTKTEPEGPTLPDNTTTTNTHTITTTTTVPPADYAAPEIIAGSIKESEFLSGCKVQNGNELIQPQNKSELQMLLSRVVKNEVGSLSMMANDLAAQKAQAVASYTYILYYNRTNKIPCGMSLKTIDLNNSTDKKIYDAVGEVAGIKILSNNIPICALYFASSPGFTSSNVYNVPYSSVASIYETGDKMPSSANWKSTYTISMSRLKDKLEAYLKTTVYFDKGSRPFFVKSYDTNYEYVLQTNAYYMKGNEKAYVSGHKLRSAVNADLAAGDSVLRSHAFKVTSSTNETLTLSVTGSGHGVGMSQWGAANYAKYAGWNYRQIISHYYSITDKSPYRLVRPVW